MSGAGSDRDIQQLEQLSAQLQQLEEQRQALSGEVERLRNLQGEITEAVDALETIETDSKLQVPVGGGAFVKATVEDVDEVIVRLGGGFAAERDREGAIETLTHRRELLSDRTDELREVIEEVESNITSIEGSARELRTRLQQQVQQELRGRGQGRDG